MNTWGGWLSTSELPAQPSHNLHGPSHWDMRSGQNELGRESARPTLGGNGSTEVAAMSDEQLYAMVMNMKQPSAPQVSTPAGARARQPPYSVDDAKHAIRTAKASIGSKMPSNKADQANESGSEDDDKSESYAGKSKRVLANRQSAHRSRLRKLQYIQDLENNVNRIQTEISQIQPQLTFLRDKYSDLAGQNHKLREKVTSLLNEARYKESLNNTLRDEVKQMLGDAGNAPHSGEEQANIFGLQQPNTVNYAAPLT